MSEIKIGQFIAQLRKERKLTQKELAAQLHITDKAVSKWERGLSCPDITLLTSLADILGVTTGELLNGQRSPSAPSEEVEKTIDNALVYAERSTKSKMVSLQNIWTASFSGSLLLGIVVCAICDIAISGTFSWSRYPITAILFAWLVFVPLVKYGRKGIPGSLTILSVLIVPFLYVISRIVGDHLILTIGTRISLYSIAYLWCVYLIFRKSKGRTMLAAAVSLLLTIPLCIIINIRLAKILSISPFDGWDLLSFAIIAVIATALFVIDHFTTSHSSGK